MTTTKMMTESSAVPLRLAENTLCDSIRFGERDGDGDGDTGLLNACDETLTLLHVVVLFYIVNCGKHSLRLALIASSSRHCPQMVTIACSLALSRFLFLSFPSFLFRFLLSFYQLVQRVTSPSFVSASRIAMQT